MDDAHGMWYVPDLNLSSHVFNHACMHSSYALHLYMIYVLGYGPWARINMLDLMDW
jgi:hypothetical protein